ncbi:MAG: class I SAM-dependent methyltransferase [Steroidobacteraceae bacterium]
MRQAPAFKDHFSAQADAYERFRPDYPPALYAWLAEQAPARHLAVDVATGNGQAAIGLAAHFDAVIATEPSAAQLRQARRHARVEYREERAEAMSLAAGSADLVVVAQAAHWFDWPAFVAECRRVLRPGGVLAIWSYARIDVEPGIDRMIDEFSRDVVGPYWPRERRHVDEGYRDLVVPFPAIEAPPFEMSADWDLQSMLGYVGTWSAVQRYRVRNSRDPLTLLALPLTVAWGAGRRHTAWPLVLKAHRC